MNRSKTPRLYAFTLLFVVSKILSSCAGGGASPVSRPSTDRQLPPTINVQQLHRLAPDGMPVGIAVPAGRLSYSLLKSVERQKIVGDHFSQITAENIMKPSYLQPAEGEFFFDHADALVAYAAGNNKTVHGHALIWHYDLPAWMNDYNGDAAAWSAMMTAHIGGIVSHFGDGDTVVSWDVVNEAFADVDEDDDGRNDLRDTVWLKNIGADYLATAFRAAHAADSNAELYYNDYNISGVPAKLNAVLDMVNRFLNDSDPVPIHGIGFQMHVFHNWPHIDQIRESLARAVATGLKVKITELDIAVNTARSRTPLSLKGFTDAAAIQQMERYEAIVAAYMDVVPADQRGGISVWGIADSDHWLRRYNPLEWPLLFDEDFKPKPALQGFADALLGGK